MAGQAYGKIECVSANPGTAFVNAQEFFKGLYDFLVYLETLGIVTLRARYAGTGASSAAAIDYWNQAAPFTANAWYLFEWRTGSTSPSNPSYAGSRSEPFYILVQWATDASDWAQTGPASPSASFGQLTITNSEAWVSIQMGVGIGGDNNPWNGTLGTYGDSGSFGSQAKGAPVWKVPSGGQGLYVFPRCNNSGGSFVTNKQNLAATFIGPSSGVQARYHFLADHDGLMLLFDDSNDANYHFLYTGVHSLRSGLAGIQDPYLMIGGRTVSLPTSPATWGDLTGASGDQGGIANRTSLGTDFYDVRNIQVSNLNEALGWSTNLTQPNRLFATPTYDEMPYLVQPYETVAGFAGSIEFFKVIQNSANLERNAAGTKLVIGSPTVSAYKAVIPWNSSVAPLSGVNRLGTTGALL